MKRNLLSIGMLALMLVFSARSFAQTTYTMITSASGLEAGAKYILVGFDDDGNAYAMSYQKTNNRHAIAVSEAGGTITTTVATDPDSQTEVFEFELGGSTGEWTIYDPLKDGYLNAPGGGNYLKTQSTLTEYRRQHCRHPHQSRQDRFGSYQQGCFCACRGGKRQDSAV